MAVLRNSLVALMLVYTTCYSQPLVSELDQYEAREDWSQPPQLFNEGTDQSLKMHKAHRFSLPMKKLPTKIEHQNNDIVPDLQVGCGDGFIVEPTVTDKKSKQLSHKTLKLRKRRNVNDSDRKKRNYFPLTHIIHTPAAVSYSVWKPQAYQISRPYYIPLWGANGRAPVYFPPQQFLLNAGFPIDNPPRGYLPPSMVTTTTTVQPPIETMSFPSRVGGINDIDDDRPVWGIFTRPAQTTTTRRPPTRRTRKPGQTTTHPPLIHISEDEDYSENDIFVNNLAANSESEIAPPANIDSDFRVPLTTTLRPTPQQRPAQTAQPSTQRPGREREPMTCVFAIISCCSATSNNVNLDCFEQRGCPGPFWGSNPCDSRFANAALGSASNYFNTSK